MSGLLVQQQGKVIVFCKCFVGPQQAVEMPEKFATSFVTMTDTERAKWAPTWRVRCHVDSDTDESPCGVFRWPQPQVETKSYYKASPRATGGTADKSADEIIVRCEDGYT